LVFDQAGNLYGTTSYGGSGVCSSAAPTGCGTVFQLSRKAGGGWTRRVIHVFNANGRDGYYPQAGLIIDHAGNLYGTTTNGGSGICSSTFPTGCGTVFELIQTEDGSWREKILHEFGSGQDGPYPSGGLTFDASGNLYGATAGISGTCDHGYGNCGAVYELLPTAHGPWREKVLHHFSYNGIDGYKPYGNLVFDAAGNLYGGTYWGGGYFCGIAFELMPRHDGTWVEKILYTFYFGKGVNGGAPGGWFFDAAGNLFGASPLGGLYVSGDVFELSPTAHGSWTQTVVSSNTGIAPNVNLVFDSSGNLYGTTQYGGSGTTICLKFGFQQLEYSCGIVFKLTPAGNGSWTQTTLHDFGNGTDGQVPLAGLVFDGSGNLYGTTSLGGPKGGGTVFQITP
jgi:uncharacterized repeat protein (TIGR03803 family)